MGVGYDSVDIAAATDLGIAVTITPGTLEESVAEHTVALLLGVTRALVQRDREVRAGRWSREADAADGGPDVRHRRPGADWPGRGAEGARAGNEGRRLRSVCRQASGPAGPA